MNPIGRPGFTLVECVVVLAVAAVLAGVAVPSFRSHALRAARLDGVQALTRVQFEQEQYRSLTGLYSNELSLLRGVQPQSMQGRYTLSLRLTSPDAYQAVATASAEQQDDRECRAITLDVSEGYASFGPSPACWGR
jgi:type IV pilus assembly protein PilE